MSFFSSLSKIFSAPSSARKTPQKPGEQKPTVQKPQKSTEAEQDASSSVRKIPVQPIGPSGTPTIQPSIDKQSSTASTLSSSNLREVQEKTRELLLEARNEALKIREKAEDEARRLRQSLTDQQRALEQKLNSLEQKLQSLDRKEDEIDQTKQNLEKEVENYKKAREKVKEKVEQVAKMTSDEARSYLLENIEKKLTKEISLIVRQKEEETKKVSAEKAREIIVEAMKHGATDFVPEYTITVVTLPDAEVKGRIIGKSGRNIHAFERATGVDVDLDGSPTEVRLSSFDPIRREVARISLQQLLKDGRIQPTRIDEVVSKVKKDVDKMMLDEGKKLCHTIGVYNLPTELMAHLGRYKFSYFQGENMIAHTLEETRIGMKLAAEIGANIDIVKLGCLLHDVGRVIPDPEGNHIELGVKLLKKFRIPQPVIDCVEQHEETVPFTGVEQVLVHLADKITSSRPGASYKDFDEHVARSQKLEEIALSYDAVAQAYVIQSGREVRVILNPAKSKDDDVIALSHSIKDQITNDMTYPGTVKVTVIREHRVKKIAR